MSRSFTTPIARREFQRQIINDLRADEAIRVDDSFLAAIEEKLGKRFPRDKRVTAGRWLDELVQEGVLVSAGDGKLKLNPQPIVGESAWKRFETLPPDAVEPRLATDLLLLYGLNSFLFLLLSFFFLPDSLVKVLGSAAGVALGILGLKSLNPRETENVARSSYRTWWVATLVVAGVMQAAILGVGFAFPCQITAIPGSTVLVDGKFLERTPDLTEEERKETKDLPSPDNIRPWLTPRLNSHFLRWDTHEIKITKKWYVDAERSEESVQNVSVELWNLWDPKKAFKKWNMKTEQKALLKIDYGGLGKQVSETPDEAPAVTDPVLKESRIRDAVEEWDKVWTTAMDQKDLIGHTRTEPYVAAIQLVEDRSTAHFEFQIRDWTDRPLKPLNPIRPMQQKLAGSDQLSDVLTSIREEVFEQLLGELGIPERINLAQATNQLAELSQQLFSEVATSAELPAATPASTVAPSPNPDVSPLPSASPSSTAVISSSPSASASPAPTAIVLPSPPSVVQKLEKVATDAVRNNQLEVAVAAQQQLKAAISQVAKSSSDRTSKLASALKQSQEVVAQAIREQGAKGRVYVHIADESQREPAKKTTAPLTTNNHFAVVGIQNVGGRAYIPDTAEVRYFAELETTKQAAMEIAEALRKANIPKPRPIFVKPSAREIQESTEISTHFEIWFARDSFSGKNQDESK